MKLFKKDNGPHIEDYEKTRSELIRLGWLAKIFNIEANRSVYDITNLGYQYYFAICMELGYEQLFSGPRQADGQTNAIIEDEIDLIEEGYILEGIDGKKLTPIGAEHIYVLTDAHGSDATPTIRLKSSSHAKNDTNWGERLGKGVASFMRGMQGMSKMAQQYDKASTKATRSVWDKTKKSSPRKKVSGYKRKRKKPTKKKRYRR